MIMWFLFLPQFVCCITFICLSIETYINDVKSSCAWYTNFGRLLLADFTYIFLYSCWMQHFLIFIPYPIYSFILLDLCLWWCFSLLFAWLFYLFLKILFLFMWKFMSLRRFVCLSAVSTEGVLWHWKYMQFWDAHCKF